MGYRFVNSVGRDMHDYLANNIIKSLGSDYVTMSDLAKEFKTTWKSIDGIRRARWRQKPWSKALKRNIVEDGGHRYIEYFFPASVRKSLRSMLSSPWYQSSSANTDSRFAQLRRGLHETNKYRAERQNGE